MKNLKKMLLGLSACFALTFFSIADAKAQTGGFYQYINGAHSGRYDFLFGSDANTCPSYELYAGDQLYIEGENDNGGQSSNITLVSGSPTEFWNYGGYCTLQLDSGQYALLKYDFYTPSGVISRYVYFESF